MNINNKICIACLSKEKNQKSKILIQKNNYNNYKRIYNYYKISQKLKINTLLNTSNDYNKVFNKLVQESNFGLISKSKTSI